MSHASLPPLERQLILESTLFQEETTPQRLAALLDQLEPAPVSFSPAQEWTRFRQAHPEAFRPGLPHRAARWMAAACLALAVVLPAVLLPQEQTAPAVSPEQARAVLYQLAGIGPSSVTPLRAELPFHGRLVEGPARLPTEAELYPLPFSLEEDVPTLADRAQEPMPEEGAVLPLDPTP
ncbi:MAG: hypothetical protein MR419_08635 [Clostridiales bacterium]|nr:hypothetical protein [Clostridiales bacterium]MDY4171451.1 hypothetical protein [Evtepia sp.]